LLQITAYTNMLSTLDFAKNGLYSVTARTSLDMPNTQGGFEKLDLPPGFLDRMKIDTENLAYHMVAQFSEKYSTTATLGLKEEASKFLNALVG
jgi:hypothetical protein